MRKRSKKFVVATVVFALLFSLCSFACGAETGTGENSSTVKTSVEESSGGAAEDSASDSSVGTSEERQKYTLIYYVRGEAVKTQDYAAGEEIADFAPTLLPWESFLGWETLPSRMPESNLSVEAKLREKENYLSLTAARKNGQTEIRLAVYGEVKLAGIVGRLEMGVAAQVKNFVCNGCLGEVNVLGTGMKFVCSQGENRTSAGELFTLTVSSETEVSLIVEELLAFDENGEIVVTRYEIG